MFPKRKSFKFLALFAALVGALTLTTLAWAGGWAVVTLDQMPANISAGQPYALGFMVRQHGQTPWRVDEIKILANPVGFEKPLTFTAKPEGAPGHYQAELLFSQPGAWEWSIQSGLFPQGQPMPPLQVAAASAAVSAAPAKAAPTANFLPSRVPGSLLGILALISLAAGVFLLARSRANRMRTLAGAGLIVLCGGLAFAFFSSVQAAPETTAPAAGSMVAVPGSGKELFLAKGCVVCHVNTRALQDAEEYSVNIGPNLSAYHNDADYLRKWLADPKAVKPGTNMPNLGLSPAEINALVEFLNSD